MRRFQVAIRIHGAVPFYARGIEAESVEDALRIGWARFYSYKSGVAHPGRMMREAKSVDVSVDEVVGPES